MALVSMTGFGRGVSVGAGLRVEVELSAVNRKQFDVRLNLPRALASLEARAVPLIQAAVSRGQVSGSVRVTDAGRRGQPQLVVDRAAASAAVGALRAAAKALDLPDNLAADVLLTLPGVVECRDPAQEPEQVWPALEQAIQHALIDLVSMRRKEGAALERDLRGRIRCLIQLRNRLERRAPRVVRAYEQELQRRVKEAGLLAERKDPQVLKEVLFFIERADVTEELVRLRSHFEHADELMDADKPVGRSLDFLCQELFREINTVGSKCADADMSRLVVDFKSQLEAVREQVQNVE